MQREWCKLVLLKRPENIKGITMYDAFHADSLNTVERIMDVPSQLVNMHVHCHELHFDHLTCVCGCAGACVDVCVCVCVCVCDRPPHLYQHAHVRSHEKETKTKAGMHPESAPGVAKATHR